MRKNGGRVRLKDIAQATGYAINTVSKALHDAPDLAEDTKAVIRGMADEMGYIANTSANSLRFGSTHTLALIVADITNPLFSILAKEIEGAARERGYATLVINTNENEDNEVQAVRSAVGKAVDGVMLCQSEKTQESVRVLDKSAIPYVLIHRASPSQSCDLVCVDEEQGGYLAGRRLVEAGRKRIVMLTAPSYISSSRLRQQGFLRAMEEAGRMDACTVVHLDNVLGACESSVRELMNLSDPPDGIFCFSDLMAFETASVLQRMGVAIGRDVGLIGFDNIQSKLCIPFGLTSVGYRKTEQAQAIVDLLLRRVDGNYDDYPATRQFEVQLVERGSA